MNNKFPESKIQDEVQGSIFIIPNAIHNGKVQVWATNDANENWCDHGYDAFGERFPSRLDPEIFHGKSEGDIVEFTVGKTTCKLKLAQTEFRYRNFGNFEDVLEKLLARAA